MQQTEKRGGREVGALEILLDLIRHAPGSRHDRPPDAVMYYVRMEGHYAVGSDTSVTVVGKLRRERALAVRPTLGEDRRRHALGSARGAGSRWLLWCTLEQGEKVRNSCPEHCQGVSENEASK